MDAVRVCDRVERVGRAVYTNVDPRLRFIMSLDKIGKFSRVLGPDHLRRGELDVF